MKDKRTVGGSRGEGKDPEWQADRPREILKNCKKIDRHIYTMDDITRWRKRERIQQLRETKRQRRKKEQRKNCVSKRGTNAAAAGRDSGHAFSGPWLSTRESERTASLLSSRSLVLVNVAGYVM